MNERDPLPLQGDRVPLGGDYWRSDPGVPLWGFADTHAHLMAHLAFGGEAFWGLPYHPEYPSGPAGLEHALPTCEPVHGGLLDINPEIGHPAAGGWPEFIIWPRFTTLVHQQVYIDWLYRAYQGGLRLITCLAVNNELLATKTTPGGHDNDDRSAIERQVKAMQEMGAWVEKHDGEPGRAWLQVVYSPEEARQVIAENRLAVVLGVEVDSLGNWRRPEDLEELSGGDIDRARAIIRAEIEWLHGLGVRQITPIHLTNNAFGGTAIYMHFLETVNMFVTGEPWEVENRWETGVRYRLDRDGDDLLDEFERAVAVMGRKRTMNRKSLVDHIPGISGLLEGSRIPKVGGGHANVRGLNKFGVVMIQELMARGFLIDVDHMSEKALDAALALVEAVDYPVMCSHTWFRDLLYSADVDMDVPGWDNQYGTDDVQKVAHEAGKRGDQVEKIAKLGGIISPIINQGDMAGLKRTLPELAQKIPVLCTGSSTAWAQAYLYTLAKSGGRGVAIGSDVNGAAGLPGPRFGPYAAFGAKDDARRMAERRREIDEQVNGVAYDTPIKDYRWHRFDAADPGAYDEEEEDIWQAIAQYEAGFNPWILHHHSSDYPEPSVQRAMELARVIHDQDEVDDMTKGFIAADLRIPVADDQIDDWSLELRAGYLARKQGLGPAKWQNEAARKLAARINAIWIKWNQMHGNNAPLQRATAGERRDFDYNIDGMAHYGLMPDFLQDLRNVGLSPDDLAPLFRGAYDYIVMWEKAADRAQAFAQAREIAAAQDNKEPPLARDIRENLGLEAAGEQG